MNLVNYIDKQAIMLDVQETEKENILTKMVGRLDECGLLLSREEAERAIMAREQLMSTGVGNGIAIPHAKTDAVRSITLSIATIRSGINYKSIDKKKVFVIFMLLAPKEAASENLKVLTTIARLLRDNASFIDRLMKSDSADEVFSIISEEETKI